MRSSVIGVLSMMVAVASMPALAASVYTCRDATGTTIYQGVPCAEHQQAVAHRVIESPPTDADAVVTDEPAKDPRRARKHATPRAGAGRQRASSGDGRAFAYECRENGRTWTQSQPCATRALDVSTSSGRRAVGGGAGARVSERELGRRELCEQVRDGSFRDPAGKRPSDDVYQRNLLRDRGC